MNNSKIHIKMRAAQPEDLEELVLIRIAAMRESLEKVGRFDPDRARTRLTRDFRTENTQCFLYKNILAGFIISEQENEEILIKHFYVHPEFQNRGIGKCVLDMIIERGKREKRDIKLITLKESRANNFYVKNGLRYQDSLEFDNIYTKSWQQ